MNSTASFFSSALQFILLLGLYFLELKNLSSKGFLIYLAFCFAQAFFLSLFSKGRFLFQLFLASSFAFNLALPFLNLLNLYEYPIGNLILRGDGITLALSDASLVFAYKASTAAILGCTAGWFLDGRSHAAGGGVHPTAMISRRPLFGLYRQVDVVFWVIFTLAVSNALVLAYHALDYGYVSVMHARNTSSGVPFITVVGDLFYKLIAVSYLWSSTSDREFKQRAILVLVPFFFQAIAGARGEFVIAVLTLAVIYHYNYKAIRYGKIIVGGSLLFLVAALWGTFRFSRDISDFQSISKLVEVLLFHFLGNSASIGVVAYTYQLQGEFFNSVPFLFGYIDGAFSFAKNYTLEGIEQKSYLAQHLTYLLNSDKLFRGSTIGTAYVAEVAELARFNFSAIFFCSGFFIYIARFLLLRFRRSLFLYVLFFHYVEVMLLAPRGSFMKLFSKETLIYGFIFLTLYVFRRLYSRKKLSGGL